MSLLFISALVPDKENYITTAFNRSGNNVLLGMANALTTFDKVELLSTRPVPSYPRGRLWYCGGWDNIGNGHKLRFLPILNIKILKNVFWGLCCFFLILNWKRRKEGEKCKVLVYNIYSPSIGLLYRTCRWLGIELYAILYDLGVPPKHLKLSRLTMFGYRVSERIAKRYIPKLNGRIVINESIVRYYAPQKDYILIDGGINDAVVSKLFPLHVRDGKEYVFVCAGMLWEQNGTRLILDAMQQNKNPNIRVVFAGKGNDVDLIKKAQQNDSRIIYKGMLSMDELFAVYEQADILLNLRIEEEIDFHFPSKLLEYLSIGRYVVSTSIAHAKRDYGRFMGILDDVSPKGLSEKMEEVMQMGKEELYNIGKSAREFMLANRTWRQRTKEILEYMGVCNK